MSRSCETNLCENSIQHHRDAMNNRDEDERTSSTGVLHVFTLWCHSTTHSIQHYFRNQINTRINSIHSFILTAIPAVNSNSHFTQSSSIAFHAFSFILFSAEEQSTVVAGLQVDLIRGVSQHNGICYAAAENDCWGQVETRRTPPAQNHRNLQGNGLVFCAGCGWYKWWNAMRLLMLICSRK